MAAPQGGSAVAAVLQSEATFVSPPFSLAGFPRVGPWELPPLDFGALSRQPRSRKTRSVGSPNCQTLVCCAVLPFI